MTDFDEVIGSLGPSGPYLHALSGLLELKQRALDDDPNVDLRIWSEISLRLNEVEDMLAEVASVSGSGGRSPLCEQMAYRMVQALLYALWARQYALVSVDDLHGN